MQDIEKTALEYFSERIRKAVLGAVQSSGGVLSCITIRKNGAVSVVAEGKTCCAAFRRLVKRWTTR